MSSSVTSAVKNTRPQSSTTTRSSVLGLSALVFSNGVDLIVAAARRGFMERVMLGGFASRLAYSAPCSLLLIHPPAERRVSADAIAQHDGRSRLATPLTVYFCKGGLR